MFMPAHQQKEMCIRDRHKVSYRPKAGEVLLGEKAISSAVVDSYICKQCKKIIIDYANLDNVKEG